MKRFARRALCALLALGLPAVAAAPAGAAVVINEIMYNSVEADDVEFVEIHNSGTAPIDLNGWYVVDDDFTHPHCLLAGVLAPGEYLVVPGFRDRFTAKYPGVLNLNPSQFDSATAGAGFGLGNGGDQVRLYNPLNALVDYVNYSDQPPWPVAADGGGPSLELYHPALDNAQAVSWGTSTNAPPEGTPGAQNSIYRVDQAPRIDGVSRDIPLPRSTDTVAVRAHVTDDSALQTVELLVSGDGGAYAPQAMLDDGFHGDGVAGDSVFGALIPPHPEGSLVRYYIAAVDALAQESLDPATAPGEYYGYTIGHSPPNLLINELVARNLTGVVDEAGQYEDWVEIRSREPHDVDLGGFYLTDQFDLTRRWAFPAGTILEPGGYLHVWCDSDQSQGPLHTNFKLGAGGGDIGLYETMDHGNVPIHALTYGPSGADVAFGFFPEGSDAPEYITVPTPGASNDTSALFSPVCINEFLTSSASGGVDDWVELHNRGPVTVDVSGWHISDSVKDPLRYTFPPGTVIPAGGYLVRDQVQLGFGFDLEGTDAILLTSADGTIGQDYFDHGPQTQDVSEGRLPCGASNWYFFQVLSSGGANFCPPGLPALGPVSGLRFNSPVEMTWDAVPGAEDYDVVRGDLALLHGSGGDFTAAVTACLMNNGIGAASWDLDDPLAGGGFFYVVRATTFSCSQGTYDSGGAGQAGGRDAEIGAAAAACP